MGAVLGDIYAVSVIYNLPGGIAQTNYGFQCIATVAGEAQQALGAAFQTALLKNTSGGLLHGTHNSVSSSRLWVTDVKPGELATYIRTYSAVAGDEASGEALPPQCAAVLSLRTALKGRSYRGRVYLPGMGEVSQSGGTWIAAQQAKYATIAAQLLAVFGPSGTNTDWRLAVISRWLNKVERATPVAVEVNAISADNLVRTQRRRVVGVGI